MAKIAVALSGGGYRASLFGLGALLYLVDAQKNREVTSISSVSGGSITNAYVAQLKEYQKQTSTNFWENIKPLPQTIAQKTLWSTPLTWAYLLILILSFFAIFYISFWSNSWSWWGQSVEFFALLIPWFWLFQQRGVVAGHAFGSNLFSPGGKPTTLEEIEQEIDHVFCSTHLNAGEHFYFSGRFVYSYRFGWGKTGRLPLHVAVQASAAFPLGFPPRWLRTKRFHFEGGKNRPGPIPGLVTLTDGGVYDNMADQWPSGVEKRSSTKTDLKLNVPDILVIVNSSAGLTWSPVNRLKVPLLGEFLALVRVISVMFDNSASLRMQALVRQFMDPQGLRGALVNIEQSPCKIPKAFARGSSPEAERARTVMRLLGDKESDWDEITASNIVVKTTLSKLGSDVSARLMYHGYTLAMANLHVLLDFPLLDFPVLEKFKRLAS